MHLTAADALINEVAGQDEAWQDHLSEQDQTEDAGGFFTDGVIFDGAAAGLFTEDRAFARA